MAKKENGSLKIIPFFVLAMIVSIIVPIPPVMLDILLVLSLGLSILVFLQCMSVKHVLEFSIFPTMIIFTTLIRVVLNVASARLILSQAEAGKLIEAIGRFSIGNNFLVGIVIYIIITVVMFIVITKGTERVSEVSARFVLDSIPGKQMAIEGELNSGSITADEAKLRRAELQRESRFYGNMDGASKFVRGDAITSLVIIFINIIVGLIIGIVQLKMSISDAIATYMVLSIGDGIVNQVPAMLIASSTAIMVTRDTSGNELSLQMKQQFLRNKTPLKIAAYVFFILSGFSVVGILPNLPTAVFMTFGIIFIALSRVKVSDDGEGDESSERSEMASTEAENNLFTDKILITIGTNLVPVFYDVAKAKTDENLQNKISLLRMNFKNKYGIRLPNTHIMGSYEIPSNDYMIKIRGIPVSSLTIKPRCSFVTFADDTVPDFGESAKLQSLGMQGYWVYENDVATAEAMGGISYSPQDLFILQLEEEVIDNIDKIITRQDIKEFKEEIAQYNQAIADEIGENKIPLSVIQGVVKNLLAEKIPIKGFEYILEYISDAYQRIPQGTKQEDVIFGISEYVRLNLADIIALDVVEDGQMNLVVLSQENQQLMKSYFMQQINENTQERLMELTRQIAQTTDEMNRAGVKFAYLTSADIRYKFNKFIRSLDIKGTVLSESELPRNIMLNTIKQL